MWNPSNRFRRGVAITIICMPLTLLIHSSIFGPFWEPLITRAFELMPSRISRNWAEVYFSISIFILFQIFRLLRLGWPEMQRKWIENIGFGVLSVAIGWVGLFCYSLILEIENIRVTASKIEAPKIHTTHPPINWDQKSPSLKTSQESMVPNFKGTIEGVWFLAQTPGNEGCNGVIAVISANIRNDGAPSMAEIGPITAVLPSGRKIDLIRIMTPLEGIAIRSLEPHGVNAYLPAKDYLPIKAFEQRIPTNGAMWGWTRGCAANISLVEINNSATQINLPFTDIKGKPYMAHVSLSDKQIEVINP
jgi:hypothetical protein